MLAKLLVKGEVYSMSSNGRKIWYFPDGELPPAGSEPMQGHESVVILNDNKEQANINMTIYYSDSDPIENINNIVKPMRVKCFRMDNPQDIGGIIIPLETQYAIKIESDVPIIVQYGRLDTRQAKMAYYTTMGLSF